MTLKHPIHPIHPGLILKNELEELNITPAVLAREIKVPANRIYLLLAGKRAMTADTALRLEQWFGISASFWMSLQMTYEIECAQETNEGKIAQSVRPRHSQLHKKKHHSLPLGCQ